MQYIPVNTLSFYQFDDIKENVFQIKKIQNKFQK